MTESASASNCRPNILLLMVDQMIARFIGSYGHPVVRTPHIDRLAAQGVSFDAAYSPCPLCTPARAAMMTGRYVSRTGSYDNASPLYCDEPTFTGYLSVAGYDTVLSGKMHFVGPDQLHGFNRRLTTDIYPSDLRWYKSWEERGKPMFNTGHAAQYMGDAVKIDVWNNGLSHDVETTFRACEYLRYRSQCKDARPFFLCASYHHPHEPFWPPQEYWDLYENAPIDIPEFPADLLEQHSMLDRWLRVFHGIEQSDLRNPDSLRTLRRAYYALCTWVDNEIGRVLDTLDDRGLAGSTVVVFCSDHGDMLCEREMVQKRCFYEYSCQVPLIVRLPDHRYAGTRNQTPASLVDLLPTFCELAGIEPTVPHDGTSLLPIIQQREPVDRIVFAEQHSEGAYGPTFMARNRTHKYVYIIDGETGETDEQLFDMTADPGEWHNLAKKPDCAAVREALRAEILKHFDPAAIALDVKEKLAKRLLIKQVLEVNHTSWHHEPSIDASRTSFIDQYGE